MSETILVIDDTEANLKLAKVLLAAEGYHILTATNAEDALKVLEIATPGLILMDIQLPGMDGLALTRLLKASPGRGNIMIIAFTAFAMKGDEEKAMAAGCDGYIAKPIDTRLFGTQIARYLQR